MDHYSEQLIKKSAEGKDIALRMLIIGLTILLVLFTIFAALMFGFFALLIISVAVAYLGVWLVGLTLVEYEYIVTNNDLDIDKITGKRSRKRLITIRLGSVDSIGEYTGGEKIQGLAATVMATDASGYGAWYLTANHEKHGKIMLLFTPDSRTLETMNQSLPYSVRLKKIPAVSPIEEIEETEE